jgi:hypothetical protein
VIMDPRAIDGKSAASALLGNHRLICSKRGIKRNTPELKCL